MSSKPRELIVTIHKTVYTCDSRCYYREATDYYGEGYEAKCNHPDLKRKLTDEENDTDIDFPECCPLPEAGW